MATPSKVRKVLGWVVIGLLVFNGLIVGLVFYYLKYLDERAKDSRNNIVAIVQSCRDKEPLKTSFLAELLHLSVDDPMNLYLFNLEEAHKRLLACPIIKSADIKKIHPGTLEISYALRQPIAYLGNFSNTAIDEAGIFFPYKPFYTLKNLPEVYIQTETASERLNAQDLNLVDVLLKLLNDTTSSNLGFVKTIDISQAFAKNIGSREIVVILEERLEGKNGLIPCVRTLRLPTEGYAKQLTNYSTLRSPINGKILESLEGLSSTQQILDMRLPNLGFIESNKLEINKQI